MTGIKIEYKIAKVDIDFHKFLKELQQLRVVNGKEDIDNKISLTRLTKTINNMIKANPEILNRLIEVDIT